MRTTVCPHAGFRVTHLEEGVVGVHGAEPLNHDATVDLAPDNNGHKQFESNMQQSGTDGHRLSRDRPELWSMTWFVEPRTPILVVLPSVVASESNYTRWHFSPPRVMTRTHMPSVSSSYIC